MKVTIKTEESFTNTMEFDLQDKSMSQADLLRNVIAVAQEWLKRMEEDAHRT